MCNSMGEKKRKMCEPVINMPLPPHPPSPSLSPSPSSCTLELQFHPNTPKISNRYTSKFARRMETDTCYRCHQQGHWSPYCPLNSSTANHDSDYPKIRCRCGHGFCEVKTANNDRNRGRKYYVCPIKRGKTCTDFVKWCDAGIDESDFRSPPYKYPECECGAGVRRKEKRTETGKYYFACPIKENHGSCGFQVWEEELRDNNKSIVPIQQSSQSDLHVFWEGYQNDETGYDLENSRERRCILKAAPSQCVGFPEFEVADYLQDIEFVSSVLWEAIEEEPFLLSHLSTPSRNRCQQSTQRHIFAGAVAVGDASFGPCPMGWLGRLIYLQPTQSLKCPPPQPFFCCIFPSFNSIFVPKKATICDGPGECNELAISSLSQHTQLSSGCHTKVSRDVVSPNKSPGSERKPLSKAQRHRQLVLLAQQQLLTDLVTLDPHELESMREAAEATFDLLKKLGVNYEQFAEHVWDFIYLASSMVEMDKSMGNSLTLEEYNGRMEEEKVRFAHIQDDCFNTEALLEASKQRRQSLFEEVSHLEAMLHEKQSQLKYCELETLKIESHLGDLKRSMLEADATLKVTAEQAEVTRKLNEERQAKQIAANTALEMAKLELENV